MKMLVTGGTGFIGRNLIELLSSKGHEVTALVRDPSKLAFASEHVKWIQGDLLEPSSLANAVKEQDYVFHLAGVVAARNHQAFYQHNVVGTQNLLDSVARFDPMCKRFIFVSSLAAHGPSRLADEADVSRPISAYGSSKKLAEEQVLARANIFPVTIVRPPMVYGPWDKQFLVLIKMIRSGFSTIVSGDARLYSVVYVRDLVRALHQMSQSSLPSGELFYIGEDRVYTWEDILLQMENILGKTSWRLRLPPRVMKVVALAHDLAGKVLNKNFPYNSDKYLEAIAPYWVCSSEKAKRDLHFETDYSLAQGMKETIAWYEQHAWL